MCIYLSDNAIFVLIFITGLVLGAIVHRIITAPMTNQDRKDLQAIGRLRDAFAMHNRPTPPKPQHPNK